MTFINLSVKSGYSFFDSTLKIQDIIDLAKKNNMNSIALTDVNAMFGVMEFVKLAQKNNIKPLIGLEVITNYQETNFPIILIAKDNDDYKKLIKLTSIISKEEFISIPLEELKNFSDLITIIPTSRSILKATYLNNSKEEFLNLIKVFQDIFINLYLGVEVYQDDDLDFIDYLRYIKEQEKLKLVAINHTRYSVENSFESLEVLMAIKNGYIAHQGLLKNHSEYFKNFEEIQKYFTEEEITNTQKIADLCNTNILEIKSKLLEYHLEHNYNKKEYLHALALKGLAKRLNTTSIPKIYLERLNYELEVIDSMGYNDYFLIVVDYVRFAKKQGIIVGPGRGSAAGSLASYVLGITDVDPIKYDLHFERFLNPGRNSMPDIDIDFPDDRRDEVIDYLRNKYQNRFANIITYQTFGAKASIRDAGKVLQIDISIIDKISKSISHLFDLDGAYKNSQNFKTLIDQYPNLFNIAKSLEGLPRQTGIHAAGVVLSNIPLNEIIPTYISHHGTLTQYDMNYLEEIGLLKMDILGLTNLKVIGRTIELIKEYHQTTININNIPLEDKDVLKMICKLETSGIFQLESEGMKRAVRNVQPDQFIEIANVIALFRPGPMESIPVYVKNKNNPDKVKYLDSSFEKILKSTHGIIVYQEQINQIAMTFAGMNASDADLLRRAISKKDNTYFPKLKDLFIKGARENGKKEEIINEVFDLIEKFVNYGFNKAHSISYAIIAMQMAYLKYHYRAAFISALLSTFALTGTSKMSEYVNESKRYGIKFLFPDINLALKNYFPLNKDTVIISLGSIKGLGDKIIEDIIEERSNGKFIDFYDFLVRMAKRKINLAQVELLIYSGALDNFRSREELLGSLEDCFKYAELVKDDDVNYSLNLIPRPSEYTIKEISKNELLLKEKELLGTFISKLPLNRQKYNSLNYVTIESLPDNINKEITLAVILIRYRTIKSKNGQYMAMASGYDETGEVEITIFSKEYQEYQGLLTTTKYLIITGYVKIHNDSINLVVNKMEKEEI